MRDTELVTAPPPLIRTLTPARCSATTPSPRRHNPWAQRFKLVPRAPSAWLVVGPSAFSRRTTAMGPYGLPKNLIRLLSYFTLGPVLTA